VRDKRFARDGAPPAKRSPFNLYLLAPATNARQQGMRTSTLPNGDAFEFFGVPISASADGVVYEVIFN